MVEVGQVIDGKYKLLRLLGDGGMGSVYEAEHLGLGVHVAMKILHSDLSRKAGLNERFVQEARVSAQIRSPHVVHVTDVDRTPEGVAYLVMELLQGETLSQVMRRERKLSVATAGEYTLQILRALEAAHALGVIHRDLKPDNVFVTFEGGKPVLKLIDFGIAKLKRADAQQAGAKNLTVAGMLMGTPEYMAPEQAYSADKVDVRADLYAVGCMMYEMLCGHTPASGEDPRVVVLKVERGEVPPLVQEAPGTPPPIAGFVHQAMAARPEARFANAREMRERLEALLAGKAGTAQLPGRPMQGPSVVPIGPSVVPAHAETPKTGTIAGAPVEGALTPANMGPVGVGSNPPPPDAMTRAPGGGTMAAPGVPMPMAMPSYQPSQPQETRGGKGLIVALALIATLLGAGAVVAYVYQSGDLGGGGGTTPPIDTTTVTTSTTPPPPNTTLPPATTTTATPLTPVPNNPVPPKPHPSGSAAPHPSGSAAPSGNAPPPFVLPPIPSNLPPFPSGFPSAFPLPSGFPPLFPPGPTPEPPGPKQKDQPQPKGELHHPDLPSRAVHAGRLRYRRPQLG